MVSALAHVTEESCNASAASRPNDVIPMFPTHSIFFSSVLFWFFFFIFFSVLFFFSLSLFLFSLFLSSHGFVIFHIDSSFPIDAISCMYSNVKF